MDDLLLARSHGKSGELAVFVDEIPPILLRIDQEAIPLLCCPFPEGNFLSGRPKKGQANEKACRKQSVLRYHNIYMCQ